MRLAALFAAIALATLAKAHSFIARQASNPNNTVSCGLNQLCCDAVSLASIPVVANALGIEGLTITDPYEIVGLNCTDIGAIPANETIQQVCPSLIACCAQTGLGNDGAVSENCSFPTNIPTSAMFRGPARTHLHSWRKRSSWYDGWNNRQVWDEDDEIYPVQGGPSPEGADGSVFVWKGPRWGWVADRKWGIGIPMLFHAKSDNGLDPVDFSLPHDWESLSQHAFRESDPPSDDTPETGTHWHEGLIQEKRRRRPLKRWKEA